MQIESYEMSILFRYGFDQSMDVGSSAPALTGVSEGTSTAAAASQLDDSARRRTRWLVRYPFGNRWEDKLELRMNISDADGENGRLGSSEGDFADVAARAIAHLQKDQISEV